VASLAESLCRFLGRADGFLSSPSSLLFTEEDVGEEDNPPLEVFSLMLAVEPSSFRLWIARVCPRPSSRASLNVAELGFAAMAGGILATVDAKVDEVLRTSSCAI
jgi:hypothetical protein